MRDDLRSAPVEAPTYRLVPSRFPPVGAFDDVASPEDLEAVMVLEGWTNDRIVATRLARLPRPEWVYGRPNASVVMAAFLHGSPTGLRFSSADLGAWYAALRRETAVAEVAHHLRRDLVQRGAEEYRMQYRVYVAELAGRYVDIRGGDAALHDPASYAASQAFGEEIRRSPHAGILYDSTRHQGGINVVCYRPLLVRNVIQAEHYELTVRQSGRITARTLTT